MMERRQIPIWHPSPQAGFSLVEILVGMAVALLATLVIAQMYANFEGQKRTSTTGSDAQENGLIALHVVERDVRMAGVGLAGDKLSMCAILHSAYDLGGGNTQSPAPGFGAGPIAPVIITDGGAQGSDIINLSYGSSVRSGVSTGLKSNMPQSSSELNVESVYGFNINDLVIVVDESGAIPIKCTLMQITQVQAAPKKLQHNPGVTAPYNPPANYQNANAWPAYVTPSRIYSIGTVTGRRYAVGAAGQTSALLVTDTATPGALATPTVGDIVNMQAQYGVATVAGTQTVDCWTDATGGACGGINWAAPTAGEINRIKAIRVAIVARSAVAEKPTIPGPCDTTLAAPQSWNGGPAIDLSADPNWQCYRYKVFQTVIPIRNVMWANL